MIDKTIAHYNILEKLGEGGMGIVYKAEDIKLKRPVALKFLSKELTRSRQARERLKREAQAAAALNHPNIVTIYEINEFEDQTYIAMEYVAGETLAEKMETWGLTLNNVIDISIQVCGALNAAHQAGIIHRDIKPQNVILDKGNRVKIVDFGLAKLKGGKKITREIIRIGTVDYMSPEQAQGEELDQRADIWSLGVVLYEMVTGQLPFKGESESEIINSIIYTSPQPPTEIHDSLPTELERIILKCLQKNREDRYTGAQPLLADLKKLDKAFRVKEKEQGAIVEGKEKPGTRNGTERRRATVIFAEISGYSKMMEKLDTEEAASIMDSCFKMFSSIAKKYGGGIDKIMGSSFTALFGIPSAIEDAPKEAVNAAIEMHNNLYRFALENNLKIPLNIHMGINTGMVIAGAAHSVMGDTVALAAQLKDLSVQGQTLVGPLTYRYTRNEFDYKQLKPINPEGRAQLTTVFELLSTKVKVYRPGFGSERMIYSEMIGREKELDKLKLHLLEVINGEGSIVSVVGEAGVGKSRLLAELKKEKGLQKVILLEGRALAMGKNLSYHLIIDILKFWAKIKEEDRETESISKLKTAINYIYPEGAAEVFPFIATMMGMKITGKHAQRVKGIEGEALKKLILKNVRELIVKISGSKPLVLVVEDLHWADISSIELLESLFRLAENHPILFMNVIRPHYKETGERLLKTIRERYGKFHFEIYPKPLDEKQCESLIKNLMKVSGLPTSFIQGIANRTEGNPFFIEEIIRSFIDEGVVEPKDGEFNVTRNTESVVIPETIQDVLMARIDRVDETTKTLLKEASVIGRCFFYKILAKVTETFEDIHDRLDYLRRSQLIRESKRLGEVEYLFKHALVQEVTYESILSKKRKELHLKVAWAIESIFSERLHEFYGMLAFHSSRGENWTKAEEYLIKAGEEALKTAASNEALNYYQEALQLYLKKSGGGAEPEKIALLEKNIALAFFNKGHMVKAVEYFDKVLAYWGERPARNSFSAMLNLAFNMLRLIKIIYFPSKKPKKIPGKKDNEIINLAGKRGEALAYLDTNRMFMDSIRLAERLNKFDISKVENGVSMFTAGSVLFSFTGISFRISRKMLDYARNFINNTDIKSVLVYNFSELLHDFSSGNWDKEFEYDENLVDRNLCIGEVTFASAFLDWLGLLNIEQGKFSSAKVVIQKLDEIGDTYDNDIVRIRKYLLTAKLLFKCGKFHDSLSEVDAGIYLVNKIGEMDLIVFTAGIKSYVQILSRDIDGTEKSLPQARELASHVKRPAPHYVSYLLIAQFLYDLHKLKEPDLPDGKTTISRLQKNAYFSGKMAVKNAKKCAVNKPETFKLMGVYYWLIGKQRKALKWWDKSIKVGEALGARPELARTYMEVGKRLLEKKSKYKHLKGIQADEYLEKARVLFNEMELGFDLHELDKLKSHIERRGK